MLCSVCGRRLKSRKSKEIGYGPVCYKKAFGVLAGGSSKDNGVLHADSIPYYDIPGQMTIEDYLGKNE